MWRPHLCRSVAHDLVQPASDMADLGSRAKGHERTQEGLLQDVLHMPVRVEAARQSQKLRTVTLDDRGKRAVVACPGETREPLVGLGTEKQFGEPDASASKASASSTGTVADTRSDPQLDDGPMT